MERNSEIWQKGYLNYRMNNIQIFNKEGLDFLSDVPDNSINLILTDPPYITSRESGMNKWVDLVEKQNLEDAVNIKTEKEWENYKTLWEWFEWFHKGGTADFKAIRRRLIKMKEDYLKYGSIYGKKYAVKTDYGDWDSEFTMETLELFVEQFYRVLKPGGTCIIFFDLWKITNLKKQLEDSKFKQIRIIEWIKTNPQPLNSKVNYLTNCREIALTGTKKAKPTFNSKYDNGIYRYPIQGGKDRFHPTQKNLLMFEDLIKKHSNEGDIILDCFLGSGTTALAALNTKRDFIGCEFDEEYCKKAIKRVESAPP